MSLKTFYNNVTGLYPSSAIKLHLLNEMKTQTLYTNIIP